MAQPALVFTFGKYKDRMVSDIYSTDKPYLEWLAGLTTKESPENFEQTIIARHLEFLNRVSDFLNSKIPKSHDIRTFFSKKSARN